MSTDLMPTLRYLRALHELLDWAPPEVLPAREVRHLVYKWKGKTTPTAAGPTAGGTGGADCATPTATAGTIAP